MTKFYTNVLTIGNNVFHRYIEDGKRKSERVRFQPSLGIRTKKETKYHDVYGNTVGLLSFDSIREMYGWRKTNEKHSDIFNNVPPIYQFISECYPQNIISDCSLMKVFNLDIETDSREGFPYPSEASQPITAITIHDLYADIFYVFAYKEDYQPCKENIHFVKCEDEIDLLGKFIEFFRKAKPDVITGWNCSMFDIPYIVNRTKNLTREGYIPDGYINFMSPNREVTEEINKYGEQKYNIKGIQHLDYMLLYKKFNQEPQESYSLNNICKVELGEEKIDYQSDYDSLSDLYDNNFKRFIDYNIRDTELVGWLNKRKKFIELAVNIAHMTKINFEDAFGSVKPWEIFLFNELKKKNILVSPKKNNIKQDFPGGYVKEPVPGMKEWLVVMDIASSYPNQIITFNLSPEMIVNTQELPEELKELKSTMNKIDGFVDTEKLKEISPLLKKHGLTMAANNEFFRTDKRGIFPQIVSQIYQGRKVKKKESKKLWAIIQDKKNELRKLEENNE